MLEKQLGVSLKRRKDTILRAVEETFQEWSQETASQTQSESTSLGKSTDAAMSAEIEEDEEEEIIVKKKKSKGSRKRQKELGEPYSDSHDLVLSEEDDVANEDVASLTKRNKKRTRGGKQKKVLLKSKQGGKRKGSSKGEKSKASETQKTDIENNNSVDPSDGAASDVDAELARAMQSSSDDGEAETLRGNGRSGKRLQKIETKKKRLRASKKLDASKLTALQRLKALREGTLSRSEFLDLLEEDDAKRQAEDKEKNEIRQKQLEEERVQRDKKRQARKAARREEKKKLKEKKKAEKKARKEKRKALKLAGKVGEGDESELSSSDITDDGVIMEDGLSDGDAFEEDDEEFVPGKAKKKKKKTVLSLKQLGTLEDERFSGRAGKSGGFKSGKQAAPQTPLHVVDRYAIKKQNEMTKRY